MSEPDPALEQYASLVERYHRTLDLMSDVGLRDLRRHIADALRYASLIERMAGPEAVVVDVGSGAGLPGVIIAAQLPRATVHLVERRRRRAAFLELVCSTLGLANASVFAGDVRRLQGVCADVVTAQAVAEPATLVELTRHLHKDPCTVISRRGTAPPEGADGGWPAEAEVVIEALEERGSLVALRLPGGSACQSSA